MSHRRSIAAIALLALVAGGAVVAQNLGQTHYLSGGVLETEVTIKIETHLAAGASGTWGVVLPTFERGEPIVLESIEPAEPPTGLSIIDILVSDPRQGAVGTASTFPPPGLSLHAVAGTVVTPTTGESPYAQVVIGVRLLGEGEGRIAALRVRYRVGDLHYETIEPYEYIVRAPGS